MKTLSFGTVLENGEVDTMMCMSNVQKLINEIETIESDDFEYSIESNGNEPINFYRRRIYFSSGGGEVSAAKVLIDYFNNMNNTFCIELIGFGEISSAAFDVFYFSEVNNKRLLDDAFSVIHSYTTSYDDRELRKSKSVITMFKKEHEHCVKKQCETYLSIGVPENFINKIKQGEDVFLNNNMLNKILRNVENAKSEKN